MKSGATGSLRCFPVCLRRPRAALTVALPLDFAVATQALPISQSYRTTTRNPYSAVPTTKNSDCGEACTAQGFGLFCTFDDTRRQQQWQRDERQVGAVEKGWRLGARALRRGAGRDAGGRTNASREGERGRERAGDQRGLRDGTEESSF